MLQQINISRGQAQIKVIGKTAPAIKVKRKEQDLPALVLQLANMRRMANAAKDDNELAACTLEYAATLRALMAARPEAIGDVALQLRGIYDDNADLKEMDSVSVREFGAIVKNFEGILARRRVVAKKPDPILALIAKYEPLRAAFAVAAANLKAVEAKTPQDAQRPRAVLPTKYLGQFPVKVNYHTEYEINSTAKLARKWLREQKAKNGKKWNAEYRLRLAQLAEAVKCLLTELRKETRRANARCRKTGYHGAMKQWAKVAEQITALEWKIADTVPTSAAGLDALLKYIERRADCSDGNHPDMQASETEIESYEISGCQIAQLMRSVAKATLLQRGTVPA